MTEKCKNFSAVPAAPLDRAARFLLDGGGTGSTGRRNRVAQVTEASDDLDAAAKVPDYFEGRISPKTWRKLARRFKFDPEQACPMLGSGQHGVAFITPSLRVLKVTNDANEARAALATKGKSTETLVRVFDVVAIPVEHNKNWVGDDNLFCILEEYLIPPDAKWKKALHEAIFTCPLDADDLRADLKTCPTGHRTILRYLINVADEASKYGIKIGDPNADNLMRREDGQHVMIDLGGDLTEAPSKTPPVISSVTAALLEAAAGGAVGPLADKGRQGFADIERTNKKLHDVLEAFPFDVDAHDYCGDCVDALLPYLTEHGIVGFQPHHHGHSFIANDEIIVDLWPDMDPKVWSKSDPAIAGTIYSSDGDHGCWCAKAALLEAAADSKPPIPNLPPLEKAIALLKKALPAGNAVSRGYLLPDGSRVDIGDDLHGFAFSDVFGYHDPEAGDESEECDTGWYMEMGNKVAAFYGIVRVDIPHHEVGFVGFDVYAPPSQEQIRAIIDACTSSKGIVLDMCGNGKSFAQIYEAHEDKELKRDIATFWSGGMPRRAITTKAALLEAAAAGGAVGNKIKAWCASEESYDLLTKCRDIAGTTWTQGACLVLARALQQLLPGSRVVAITSLGPHDEELAQHAGVLFDGVIIDADGAHTEEEWLEYWEDEEGLDAPSIRPDHKVQWGSDVPRSKKSITAVTNALREVLGETKAALLERAAQRIEAASKLPATVYHGTSTKQWERLKAAKFVVSNFYVGDSVENIAENYAEREATLDGSDTVVLEIKTKKIGKLQAEPDFHSDEEQLGQWIISGDISRAITGVDIGWLGFMPLSDVMATADHHSEEDPSAHQIDMSDPEQNMEESVKTPAEQMRLALNTLESEFSIADGELITADDVEKLRELTAQIRKLVEAFESRSAAYRVENEDKPRSGNT